MNKLKTQVGGRVREIRKARELTQFGLAEKVGLSLNMIGCIERGEKFPSASTFEKLSEALNVPVHEFFSPPPSMRDEDYEKQAAIKQLEGLLVNTSDESLATIYKIVNEIKGLMKSL
jgi:transcriptional regulator with XRE-family HTH domain